MWRFWRFLHRWARSPRMGEIFDYCRSLRKMHAFLDGFLFLGDGQQLRVKLHKRMLNRGVLVVALPAIILGWRDRFAGWLGIVEREVGPLVGEARSVFHFHIQSHEFSLKMATLIDGALGLRA